MGEYFTFIDKSRRPLESINFPYDCSFTWRLSDGKDFPVLGIAKMLAMC